MAYVCLLVSLGLLAPAERASAQALECAEIRWAPSAGPVTGYDVYAEIDGGEMLFYDSTPDPRIVVGGPLFRSGDALRFQVVPYAADGRRGQASAVSDVIFCEAVPTPTGVAVESGPSESPIRIVWDPVDFVEFYVVLRASAPESPGTFLARSEEPYWNDAQVEAGVDYYYSVVAVAGRQVSGPSETVVGGFGGGVAHAVPSVQTLTYVAGSGGGQAVQSLTLRNVGEGPVDYQAWVAAQWITVTPEAGRIDQGTATLSVQYDLSQLPPGEHVGRIDFYSYYTPPPGEEFVLAPPERVEVRLTVLSQNEPPTIEGDLDMTVQEGRVTVVPLTATDPNPGDSVELWIPAGLPAWAVFDGTGSGEATLTLSPGYEDAGTYVGVIGAWDDADPAGFDWRYFTIEVQNVNRLPQADFILDQTLSVGETRQIQIHVTDPDPGDIVAIVPSSLPDFAQLTQPGFGVGELTLAPGPGDEGSYLLIISFVDSASPPGFTARWFRVTVEP